MNKEAFELGYMDKTGGDAWDAIRTGLGSTPRLLSNAVGGEGSMMDRFGRWVQGERGTELNDAVFFGGNPASVDPRYSDKGVVQGLRDWRASQNPNDTPLTPSQKMIVGASEVFTPPSKKTPMGNTDQTNAIQAAERALARRKAGPKVPVVEGPVRPLTNAEQIKASNKAWKDQRKKNFGVGNARSAGMAAEMENMRGAVNAAKTPQAKAAANVQLQRYMELRKRALKPQDAVSQKHVANTRARQAGHSYGMRQANKRTAAMDQLRNSHAMASRPTVPANSAVAQADPREAAPIARTQRLKDYNRDRLNARRYGSLA